MNKIYLVLSFLILMPTFLFGQDGYWTKTNIESSSKVKLDEIKLYRALDISIGDIRSYLSKAPVADANYKTDTKFELAIPNPDGGSDVYQVMEIAVLSPALAAEYTTIKTYKVIGEKGASGRITLSDFGLDIAIHKGNESFHIESASKVNNQKHIAYYDKDQVSTRYSCESEDLDLSSLDISVGQSSNKAFGDCQLRSYRMAVTATGEYTTVAGSQAAALAKSTATINNVSDIFERDATVTFTLVSTTGLMFTNAATDPFTGSFPTSTTLNQSHTAITAALGTAGFDLGHVFSDAGPGGSGLAQVGSVCNSGAKGRAASRRDGTTGGAWERLVAHEIAHNFTARHTMSAGTGGCAGNVTLATAYEVGGGSTIMAYSNVCTGASYQSGVDGYFHTGNISQIISFAEGSTCPSVTAITNSQPLVTSDGAAFTIPVSTPFCLSATGSDPDGDNVIYNWEQLDASPTVMGGFPASGNTSGPMFRSYPPTTEGNLRYLPALSNLVTGTAVAWEVLPTASRQMNFRVTARDNVAGSGCLAYDSTIVTTTTSSGPFTVTSQSAATTWVGNGTNTATITWNVAGTNTGAVSCANVDILFSDDEGQTFPHVILANTPNDGSQSITIPSLNACKGRIMVKCSDNIFFNINSGDIDLSSACLANGTSISPTSSITANGGSAALSFTETPSYGTAATISGSITTADPQNALVADNSSGGCFGPFNSTARYDVHTFRVNVAGNYTLTRTGNSLVMNLYQGSYNPTGQCTNWLASSATVSGSATLGPTINNIPLCPGTEYILVMSSFSGSTPSLPAAYTVTASTTPPGGGLFTSTPNPGAGYAYNYVIVNTTSGNIVSFTSSPVDMTNTTTYVPGNYEVVGLSHSTSNSLASLNTTYNGTSYAAFKTAALAGTVCANPSSNSRMVTILTPLPVSTSDLTGNKVGNTSVLNWSTFEETNSYQFELERSIDGATYEKIGVVEAAGNSSAKLGYKFIDYSPRFETNYYRLKNVDIDGSFTFSNIAEVYHPVQETSLSLYPNPAKDIVKLSIESKKVQAVEIVVTDLLGKVLISERQNIHSGMNELEISISNLAKGNYIVRLKTNDSSLIEKLSVN